MHPIGYKNINRMLSYLMQTMLSPKNFRSLNHGLLILNIISVNICIGLQELNVSFFNDSATRQKGFLNVCIDLFCNNFLINNKN